MKVRLHIGIFLMWLPAVLHASAGTEGAAFLNIPVGAAPAALGSAYTALATNAYAPIWNPAGLGNLEGSEVAAQHVSYLESIHYEYMSFVRPFAKETRGLGFSVQYLGSGDIPRTDVTSGNTIGSFSSYYASYNLSYGQKITDRLSLGATVKTIRASIDDVSAGAYATDLGALYKPSEKMQFGASMVNLGTKLKFLNDGDDLPLAFKIGGAYKPDAHYLLTAEGVYQKTGVGSFHVGGEWRPIEMISLRAGYRTDNLNGLSPLAGFSTGMGLYLWGQEFSYAWAPYGALGDAQYFSLLIRFGAPAESRRNLIQYQSIKKHRTVKGKDEMEPETQQLMQLLQENDEHMAQTHEPAETTKQ